MAYTHCQNVFCSYHGQKCKYRNRRKEGPILEVFPVDSVFIRLHLHTTPTGGLVKVHCNIVHLGGYNVFVAKHGIDFSDQCKL